MDLRALHLFAGSGGGLLGGLLVGHVPVCAVEIDPYCQRVLVQRQRDGLLPPFPIWDDVRDFAGPPWHGRVDVIHAGFPCQPWSTAGPRTGAADDRNLWPDTCRIIGEVRPRYVFLENVPALLTQPYFGTILGELSTLGYDTRWTVLGADDVGAPHHRKRLWLLAYSHSQRLEEQPVSAERAISVGHAARGGAEIPDAPRQPLGAARQSWLHGDVGHADGQRCPEQQCALAAGPAWPGPEYPGWWKSEPRLDRVAHRISHRVDRLRAIGNGQVPLCVAVAWRLLTRCDEA